MLEKLTRQKIYSVVLITPIVSRNKVTFVHSESPRSFKKLARSHGDYIMYVCVCVYVYSALCKNRVRYNAIKMTKKSPVVLAGFACFSLSFSFFFFHYTLLR